MGKIYKVMDYYVIGISLLSSLSARGQAIYNHYLHLIYIYIYSIINHHHHLHQHLYAILYLRSLVNIFR